MIRLRIYHYLPRYIHELIKTSNESNKSGVLTYAISVVEMAMAVGQSLLVAAS